MSKELKGFVACVTGEAQGLGASIVKQLARQGATVILADVLHDAGESLATELQEGGLSVIFKSLDVTSEEQWEQLVTDINNAFGRLDIVVNNAAIIVRKRLSELSIKEWNRALSVNLTGVFLSVKHCRPLLARSPSASIVNVSFTAGMIAHLDPSYTASKWKPTPVVTASSHATFAMPKSMVKFQPVRPVMPPTPRPSWPTRNQPEAASVRPVIAMLMSCSWQPKPNITVSAVSNATRTNIRPPRCAATVMALRMRQESTPNSRCAEIAITRPMISTISSNT